MTRVTKQFTLPVSSYVPLWWSDDSFHPVGQWKGYAGGSTFTGSANQKGSTIADVDTGVTSGIFSYSGAAVDQDAKRMYVTGGGHSNYSGNEILRLDLSANTPVWTLWRPRTQALGTLYNEGQNGSGQFAADIGVNGRPVASHTSNVPQCYSGKLLFGQLWGITGTANGTPSTTAGFLIDTETSTTTAVGKAVATAGFTAGEGGAIALVESRNEYWGGFPGHTNQNDPFTYCRNATTGALKPDTNSATGVYTRGAAVPLSAGSSRFGAVGAACEIYPDGSRPPLILYFTQGNGQLTTGWWLIDIGAVGSAATPHVMYNITSKISNSSGVTLPTTGTSFSWASLHHLHGTQTIYMAAAPYNAGNSSQILKIAIPTGTTAAELATKTWSISSLTPGGATLPTMPTLRVYGRLNLIRDMGDGRPAIVCMPGDTGVTSSTSRATYVLKMPAGGL